MRQAIRGETWKHFPMLTDAVGAAVASNDDTQAAHWRAS
ncbi:hypothetical protein AKJ08_1220 [Vulgatibacter incomptus]|uniref:Uncharacterized protein n=1 Tax=Vulgatibacter incomptus TaxID=1391653 RepID=A0A0K1PBB9_9BACT|nr:hypothetical protein AKJ08_1220 [Vulgatibacter incomptus]